MNAYTSLALVATLLLASPVHGDWTMLGGGPHRHAVTENIWRAVPEQTWSVRSESSILASAVVAGGRIFVPGADGRIAALSAADGNPLWTVVLDGPVSATPAIHRNTLIVPTKAGTVFGLDTETGAERWRSPAGSPVVSSPAVFGDAVYFGSMGLEVEAMDAVTGRLLWKYPASDYKYGGLYAPPAVDEKRVYIGGKNGWIYALKRDTGELDWWVELGSSVYGSPVRAGADLVVGSYDRNMYCLDAEEGTIRWRTEIDDWPKGTPLVLSEAIYVASRSGVLHALDRSDGQLLWSEPLSEGLRHGPIGGVHGVIVLGTTDGRIVGFDVGRRKTVWEVEAGGEVFAPPTPLDGGLLATARNGRITRLDWRER